MTKRGAPSKKQRFRSFTTDDETLDSLKEVADSRKLSVNALLQGIIEDYLTMDRQRQFMGIITLPEARLKAFLNYVNESKEFWDDCTSASISFWEHFVEYEGFSKDVKGLIYAVNRLQLNEADVSIVEEARSKKVYLMHDLGRLWSRILENELRIGHKYIIGKELPDDAIKILDNGLVVHL